MIKYLEVPDFHFSMKWKDICIQNGKAVYDAIKENEIDFIVIPGDLHDKPILSSNSGGLPVLIEIVKSWLSLCPVVAIEGTPSHDGPGAYAPLEEAGLVLLRPGKTYGLYREGERTYFNKNHCGKAIIEITESLRETSQDAILFGIPELNTENIHARLNLSAEEANAEAIKQLSKYIETYIAPERARFPEIPAIGLLHGVVSDAGQEFSDDVIIRASDIVIKTDVLARANLTRWSLGHIHTPWESEKISAGYAGSWGQSWNEKGFVPAMNIIELSHKGDVGEDIIYFERIPYGTPRREKIIHKKGDKLPNPFPDNLYAVWIETEDETITEIPEGFHPWSRITRRAEKKESRRITKEEAAKAKTLVDTFKLFDPEVKNTILKKVETIEKSTASKFNPVDINIEQVTINGCIFFKDKLVRYNPDSGLSMIVGPNGSGKSSLAAFCTPYPVIVGKDTKSGRQSAIKDFFNKPDSSIEKRLTVNGKQHRHLINIKAAHTQSAKVECFLFIEDESILDRGTFDEMFMKCEELYGSFNDYLLTTFYVQPLQGKTGSSLMSATMTEIRNLVQSIAGIDRETEKRIALDKLDETNKQIVSIDNWLAGAEIHKTDIDQLEDDIKEKNAVIKEFSEDLEQLTKSGKEAQSKYESLLIKKENNDKEIARKESDEQQRHQLWNEEKSIIDTSNEAYELIKLSSNFQSIYEQQKKNEEAIETNRKLKLEYDEKVMAYRKELLEKQEGIRSQNAHNENQNNIFENKKRSLEAEYSTIEKEIEMLNKPCFYCGKNDPEAESKINELKSKIHIVGNTLNEMQVHELLLILDIPTELDRPIPTPPEYLPVNTEPGSSAETLKKLDKVKEAESKIKLLESQKALIQEKLKELDEREYKIDHALLSRIYEVKQELESCRQEYSDCNQALQKNKTELQNLESILFEARQKDEQLEKKKSESETLKADSEDWKYIAAQLQPAKIPAMELDIILDEIDEEATKNIQPYRDGVLSFNTLTQAVGKKSTVDRFDIIIHDNQTGTEKSFIEFSPGQKAFLNDAYIKALIRKRNERSQRKYSPVIIDEADGPIHPDDVPEYYEMQQRYWIDKNAAVIVISHAINAHEYISKHINIEEVLI